MPRNTRVAIIPASAPMGPWLTWMRGLNCRAMARPVWVEMISMAKVRPPNTSATQPPISTPRRISPPMPSTSSGRVGPPLARAVGDSGAAGTTMRVRARAIIRRTVIGTPLLPRAGRMEMARAHPGKDESAGDQQGQGHGLSGRR